MNSERFEQLRVPVALGLLVVALFVFWPRGGDPGLGADASPSLSVVVGEPVGGVFADPTPTETPAPTPTLAPTATPAVTSAPAPDTFSAEVLACREVSGSRCRGEFVEFPRRGRTFTALVRFTDARAGDTISVALSGPVIIDGGPYTLGGGGDGYYYSTITYGDLPDGDYALIAMRNGAEVARITLRSD
jgi:hypothetical protein